MGETAATFWGAELRELLNNASDPAIKRIPKEVREKTLSKKPKKQSELKFSNSKIG